MSLPSVGPVKASLRTILVKVSPSPVTLSERRAVLGALKKYAEVDVFKKLQEPSHFVSILAEPQMADNLIAKSPLQFDVATQPPNHHTKPIITARLPASALPPPPNPTPPTTKTFLVKISLKPDYNHKTHIREALTYGRWPEHTQQEQEQEGENAQALLFRADSVARAALSDTVPPGLARAGLADWESAGQLGGDDEAPATWLSRGGDFAGARRAKRGRNRSGFESLVGLWEGRRGGGPLVRGAVVGRREGGGGGGGEGRVERRVPFARSVVGGWASGPS